LESKHSADTFHRFADLYNTRILAQNTIVFTPTPGSVLGARLPLKQNFVSDRISMKSTSFRDIS
jgi:hypothetical protein